MSQNFKSNEYFLVFGFLFLIWGIVIQGYSANWKFGFFLIMLGLFDMIMWKLLNIENKINEVK